MGALGIKRNRTLDSVWEVSDRTIMALEATLGVVIGSDDGRVIYIQDPGVKEVGRGYIDRATKKVHICKERTEDVINTTTKFADHSIQTIYNKLQNLVHTSQRGDNWCRKYADGRMEQWGHYGLTVDNGINVVKYIQPFINKGQYYSDVVGSITDLDAGGNINWHQFDLDSARVHTIHSGFNFKYYAIGWWK